MTQLVLSKNMANIVDEYVGMSEHFLLNVEKKILEKLNNEHTLLLDNNDFVIGIFTTKDKATKYMIRDGIINYLSEDNDREVVYTKSILQNFDQWVLDHVINHYKLFPVNIDITKPIYINSNHKFLINDLSHSSEQKSKKFRVKKNQIPIDPELQDIKIFEVEE